MSEPTADVVRMIQQDREAELPSFEGFFEAEKLRLYRALCLITRNRFEAEEITQDAFVRLLERWDRVSAMEDPTGYLYVTAMNTFRKAPDETAASSGGPGGAPLFYVSVALVVAAWYGIRVLRRRRGL